MTSYLAMGAKWGPFPKEVAGASQMISNKKEKKKKRDLVENPIQGQENEKRDQL